jgi:hypothetical protein
MVLYQPMLKTAETKPQLQRVVVMKKALMSRSQMAMRPVQELAAAVVVARQMPQENSHFLKRTHLRDHLKATIYLLPQWLPDLVD